MSLNPLNRWLLLSLVAVMPTAFAEVVVSGRVLEAGTLDPISGAMVALTQQLSPFSEAEVMVETSSNDAGEYVLTVGGGTAIRVVAQREGFRGTSEFIGSASSGSFVRDFHLEEDLHGTIVVSVVDDATGQTLSGIRVVAEFTRGEFTRGDISLADGPLVWADTAAGEFSLCATDLAQRYVARCATGYTLSVVASPNPTLFELEHGQTLEFTMRMERGALVAGKAVKSLDGTPLRSQPISLWFDEASDETMVVDVTTGDDGHFSLSNVPPGRYRPRARTVMGYAESIHPGLSCMPGCPDTDAIELGSTPVDSLEFSFRPEASIEGHVFDAATRLPLQAVGVFALQNNFMGNFPVGTKAITDAEGYFRIDYVPNAYSVTVQTNNKFGYIDQVWSGRDCFYSLCRTGSADWFQIALGGLRSDIELLLGDGDAIAGHLQGSVPSHDVRAEIVAYGSDGLRKWEHKAGRLSGDYMTGALPAGTYYVRAIAEVTGDCQWYPAVPCLDNSNSIPTDAVAIEVSANDVSGIDFVLDNRVVFAHGFD